MGRGGLEPPTSRLSGVRSNHLSYRPGFGFGFAKTKPVRKENCQRQIAAHRIVGAEPVHALSVIRYANNLPRTQFVKEQTGGAYRDRTDDPLLAKQVLSQLS